MPKGNGFAKKKIIFSACQRKQCYKNSNVDFLFLIRDMFSSLEDSSTIEYDVNALRGNNQFLGNTDPFKHWYFFQKSGMLIILPGEGLSKFFFSISTPSQINNGHTLISYSTVYSGKIRSLLRFSYHKMVTHTVNFCVIIYFTKESVRGNRRSKMSTSGNAY